MHIMTERQVAVAGRLALGVRGAASDLGISPARVHQILTAMERRGQVRRAATGWVLTAAGRRALDASIAAHRAYEEAGA